MSVAHDVAPLAFLAVFAEVRDLPYLRLIFPAVYSGVALSSRHSQTLRRSSVNVTVSVMLSCTTVLFIFRSSNLLICDLSVPTRLARDTCDKAAPAALPRNLVNKEPRASIVTSFVRPMCDRACDETQAGDL